MTEKKNKAAQELGQKGGEATLKKHGREHYVKAINKRWAAERTKVDNSEKVA